MPLTWLGQLKPTSEQQIALQRALLKLVREDEEMRRKAAEKPALARRLVEEPMPPRRDTASRAREIYEGRKGEEKRPWATTFDWAGAREKALATQLRGAQPTPGYVSGEERMKLAREKIVGEKEELAGKAGEFWERITPLDDEGRKIALDAARDHQPELYDALIEQGFVDPTTGEAVRPEEKKKPMTRDTHVEDGWLYEDILYDDGTSTHNIIGRAEEVEAEGATVAEIINAQKLGIDIEQHEERFYRDALKIAGDSPRIGIDMLVEDGKERPAEQKDVDAWKTSMNNTIKFLREAAGVVPGAEVPVSMEDVKSMYEGRPDLISDVQRQLDLAVTGVWDDPLEEALRTYGGVE
jgi:hypothetical protein